MDIKDIPRVPDAIEKDFTMRRSGLLKALTDDADELFRQADPLRENLSLYGNRDGSWSVELPVEEVPPELPEPCPGINFARDGMQKRDWLALVAVHSDSWLLAVAFFYAANLDATGRAKLFKAINAHPTLFEIVTNRVRGGNKKPKFNAMGRPNTAPKSTGRPLTESDLNLALRNRPAELFWPDDGLWYLVEVQSFNPKTRQAKILYASGEVEDLEMDDILRDKHMCLFDN